MSSKRFKPKTKKEHDGYMLHDKVKMRNKREGVIKYIGKVKDQKGIFFGIELTNSTIGRHNGTQDNVEYYKCRPHKGIFVETKQIIRKITGTTRKKKVASTSSTLSKLTVPTVPSASQRTPKKYPKRNKRTESTPNAEYKPASSLKKKKFGHKKKKSAPVGVCELHYTCL